MGWIFSERWSTREELRDHLTKDNGLKTLKSCWVGNNLWAVQEGVRQDGTVVQFIALYLCARHGHGYSGWGYKGIDESMGPHYVSCPVSYIEMVEAHEQAGGYEPAGHAKEWRASVRADHARRTRKHFATEVVRLGSHMYRLLESLGRKGWRVYDMSTGTHYRMSSAQLGRSETCLPSS